MDKRRIYAFSAVILVLYAVAISMSMFLFIRTTDKFTEQFKTIKTLINASDTWTSFQLNQLYSILTQNSEYLSLSTKAITQNQFAIYQAINGTATNILIQNQNLANFFNAESINIAAMKIVLQGLQERG